MNNKSYIIFVYSHSESIGSHYNFFSSFFHKFILDSSFFIYIKITMIK
nr:MAG TPA: hypothetical protein [Inoviridae sp.]